MLDVALESLSYRYRKSDFCLSVSELFPAHSHTALAGAGGSGKSTLLQLIAGTVDALSGTIRIGVRDVTNVAARRRPVLFASGSGGLPGRWSVEHLLIAGLRTRSLDRTDRFREFELIVERWGLGSFARRRLQDLSSGERLRSRLGWIESLRPAVLLAERLFEGAAASEKEILADTFHRLLRTLGTTLISEVATLEELGWCDRCVVLQEGSVVTTASVKALAERPTSLTAAAAIGTVNAVPVGIHAGRIDSPIGSWPQPADWRFTSAVALLRPTDFELAPPGEEYDFILGIEEARFDAQGWTVAGFVTGGVRIEVRLPAQTAIHKGRLLPLRIMRLPTFVEAPHGGFEGVPTDVVPRLSDSR